MPYTPTLSSANSGLKRESCATASIARDTSAGRRRQLSGPGVLWSLTLSPRCSGTATTKPISTRVRARSECTHGEPPEPCDMTISRPLPRAGTPCQAIWKVKGPRLSVCASLLDG
jgi:hypothetical protein